MRALSIRQPYAEEILQGLKTIEYRPNPTKKIGERFFIYAAMQYPKPADLKKFCKRYRTMKLVREAEAAGDLSARRDRWHRDDFTRHAASSGGGGKMPFYHWHLTDVERLELPMKPHRMPQAQWFAPFNLPITPRGATTKRKLPEVKLRLVRH